MSLWIREGERPVQKREGERRGNGSGVEYDAKNDSRYACRQKYRRMYVYM
jgi:hypothetical protein